MPRCRLAMLGSMWHTCLAVLAVKGLGGARCHQAGGCEGWLLAPLLLTATWDL